MIHSSQIFPGIPLVESPLFGLELENMDLSDTERSIAAALNRDGFAVFDFPDSEIDLRIDRIRKHLSPALGIDDQDGQSSKLGGAGRIQDAWKIDEDVKAIASNPQVLDLLSRLYGRRAFPFQTLNFPVGTQQTCHTDAVHFSSIPPRFMCGVWLAMEDISADAGPLCYYAGSHKWPILDNAAIGRRGSEDDGQLAQVPFHDAWDALIAATGATPEHFLARKGQALIWCANLLHGGSPQVDPTLTRWSQVTHYFFDDCVYYTPSFSDEYLGRLALRELVSVADGSPKPNLYLGERILPAKPASAPRPGAFRRLGRSIGRSLRKIKRSNRAEPRA